MRDDKTTSATRAKAILRQIVSDGKVFCPLSFGLICELYTQNEGSRLKTGTLMEELRGYPINPRGPITVCSWNKRTYSCESGARSWTITNGPSIGEFPTNFGGKSSSGFQNTRTRTASAAVGRALPIAFVWMPSSSCSARAASGNP